MSDDALQDIELTRKALEKEHGRPITDDEAKNAHKFLVMLAEMAIENAEVEYERNEKLKENPKGFHLEGGHTCCICKTVCYDDKTWYDHNGIKCATCQYAIDKKIVPASICKDEESYYTQFELERHFNLNKKVLQNWAKAGIIKVREISGLERGTHCRIYLMRENKKFLPPKKLLKSEVAVEEKDGVREYVFPVYWYSSLENPLERIEKYGISQYLKVVKK